MMKDLPYDNYLSEKVVNLPSLKKKPKDKKVLLDIEKINQKRQEKEYKDYLQKQLKDF